MDQAYVYDEQRADRLPPDVLITALSSRLCDLQWSRIDDEAMAISPPATTEGAGRRALIAGCLLEELERKASEGDTGYIPLSVLFENIVEVIPDLKNEELRFIARFLHTDREVKYDLALEEEVSQRSTRNWTRLVNYQDKYKRIKLDKAGRLWIRILKHRDHWLFEDKEVEKMLSAINGGLFERIPAIATEAVTSIRLFDEQLTSIAESASFEKLIASYMEHREHYNSMIENCRTASSDAEQRLLDDEVRRNFETWQEKNPDSYLSLAILREHVIKVLRATESLNRRWAETTQLTVKKKSALFGVPRLDIAIDQYLLNPPEETVDRNLIDGLCGWSDEEYSLSLSDLYGSLPIEDEPENTNSLEYDLSAHRDSRAKSSWLRKNQERIIAILSDGNPKTIQELSAELELKKPNDLLALFCAFSTDNPLGNKVQLKQEYSGEDIVIHLPEYRVMTSKTLIRTEEDS
jgi:hypothetical protein